MNGKTNKWGPALTLSADGQQAAARPTDIAATIAADLSIKLRTQLNPVCVALPQQSTFSAEFEINDSPRDLTEISWLSFEIITKFRNVLTKKHAHEQLNSLTGAFVKLRGIFKQLDAGDPYPNERKLHLFITAGSPEMLQNALSIIRHCSATGLVQAAMQSTQSGSSTQLHSHSAVSSYQYPSQQQVQHLGHPFTVPSFSQLVSPQYQDQRFAPQSTQLLQAVSSGLLNLQQKSFVYHARVSLGALAGPNIGYPGFSVKGKILGHQGHNVKHITTVTGAKVQLKGRGANKNPEADGTDDMYLDVNASSELSLNQAVELSSNLIETVLQEYIAAVTKPLQHVVPGNGYAQPNVYGVAPQQYYPAPYPTMPLGNNGVHGHPVLPPRGLPAPLFPPPPVPCAQPPPRPVMPLANMQHPAPRASPTGPTPPVAQNKGCVPFMYPDGDAVVRAPNPHSASGDIPPQPALCKAPESSEGKDSSVTSAPPRLSLNGSTFEARMLKKADHSSSSRSGSSSSGSGSSSDRHSRVTNDDGRSGSSGSNKRRRGFQESSAYTAPVDCPLPIRTTHEVASASTEQRVEPLDAPSDTPRRTQGSGSLEPEATARNRTFDPNSLPALKGIEPASDVMAALAAMTERRLQAKMSRPMVPSFLGASSSAGRPPVPSFAEKPPITALHTDSTTRPQSLSSDTSLSGVKSDTQRSPTATSFKLPGLTAYEDDDDDED